MGFVVSPGGLNLVSPFSNSIFHNILLGKGRVEAPPTAILGGHVGSSFALDAMLEELPIVFMDFETTGTDTRRCKITEIGAVKYFKRKEIGRFSQLVNPGESLAAEVVALTGITDEMLADAPPAGAVLPQFHEFLRGCVCVAHNAEFDASILAYESVRVGIRCNYHVLCTLKMSRALIKDIERRNLDSLAAYFGLSFESRHRSIGDILVTAGVMWRLLDANPSLRTLKDLMLYRQEVPDL